MVDVNFEDNLELSDPSCEAADRSAQRARFQCCEDTQELALAYKALSHPARLMILHNLAKAEESCCGDLCSVVPLAQSSVSQHLKVLREAGFIELEQSGPQSVYRLNGEKLEWLRESNVMLADLAK